jgi:hypothetical protein
MSGQKWAYTCNYNHNHNYIFILLTSNHILPYLANMSGQKWAYTYNHITICKLMIIIVTNNHILPYLANMSGQKWAYTYNHITICKLMIIIVTNNHIPPYLANMSGQKWARRGSSSMTQRRITLRSRCSRIDMTAWHTYPHFQKYKKITDMLSPAAQTRSNEEKGRWGGVWTSDQNCRRTKGQRDLIWL